jgi:hypothetical protein
MEDLTPPIPELVVCVLFCDLRTNKFHLLFLRLPKNGPQGSISVSRDGEGAKFIQITSH